MEQLCKMLQQMANGIATFSNVFTSLNVNFLKSLTGYFCVKASPFSSVTIFSNTFSFSSSTSNSTPESLILLSSSSTFTIFTCAFFNSFSTITSVTSFHSTFTSVSSAKSYHFPVFFSNSLYSPCPYIFYINLAIHAGFISTNNFV